MAGKERSISSSIFAPFLRSKARTVVSLAGIAHKPMRELLVDWCVRMKGEVDALRLASGRFPDHRAHVLRRTDEARGTHASADGIIARCVKSDYQRLFGTIEESLLARKNALDGAARQLNATLSQLANTTAKSTESEQAANHG